MSRRKRSMLRRVVMGLATVAASGLTAALVGGLHAAATTTLDVNSTADVDTLTTETACPATCTLREAIHVANNAGGTVQINVPAGTYALTMGELQIGTFPPAAGVTGYNVTLQGAGAASTTIQQTDGMNRVLDLDPTLNGNVNTVISGVTITGGHDSYDSYGGAGVIAGYDGASGTSPDNTTLSSCVITDNHVSSGSTTADGGGVQNVGGNLTITNCTISNNSAGTAWGGGVFYDSHYPHLGTLTVTGSSFSGNTLTNTSGVFRGGAALSLDGTISSNYFISHSSFTGNTATGSGTSVVGGGAIYSAKGNLQVTTSRFTGNHADGPPATNAGGGAINVAGDGDPGGFFVRLNRIVDNAASNGPSGVWAAASYSFTNNWWGCNTGTYATGCDHVTNALTTPRLLLTATASPSTVPVGGTSTITASLRINTSNQDTYTLLGGAIPDGVTTSFSLPVLGTVSPGTVPMSAGMATATYTAGTTGGTDSVIVELDHVGLSAVIVVQQAPTIASPMTRGVTVGVPFTTTLYADGFPIPTWSATGDVPSGVTLSSAGVLSGTPAPGTGGVHSFSVTASNAAGADTQTFTMTVYEGPGFTSASSATFTAGSAGSFTVQASGYPAPSITLTGGTTPSGVTYNSSTHVLSGPAAAGTGGVYPLTFTAGNGAGSTTQSFTLTVNEAPSITSALSLTVQATFHWGYQFTANGYPAPAFSANGLPSWATLGPSGNLDLQPPVGSGGVYTFPVTAQNGVTPNDTRTFTLTVNEAPSFSSAPATTFTVGSFGSFTAIVHGYPAPTVWQFGGLPGGVGFNSTTHVLSGTPVSMTGGVYPLTFTAFNEVSSTNQAFTLTVNETPGITSGAAATFTVGAPGSFTVTTLGYPYPNITMDTSLLPSGVGFLDNHDGTATMSGTPASGTGGTYHFIVYAANGIGMDKSQAFTLTVQAGPYFTSADTATFTVGSFGSFTVKASGIPAVTDIGLTGGTLPPGVSYADNGDGTATVSGTPDAGTGGTWTAIFTASNGTPPDATQTFTLVVDEAPSITSASTATYTAGAPVNFTVTTHGHPTVTSVTQSGTLPTGVTFTDNGDGTGTLTGAAAGGTGGIYSISFGASNGVAPDASQSFSLVIDEHPLITSAGTTTFVAGSFGSFTVTTSGYPVPIIGEQGALPGGVGYVDNGDGTGTLSGTPAIGSGGNWDISFGANNGVEPASSQHFILTVQQAPAITSANHATFAAGGSNSFSVTTTGYPAPALSSSGTLPSGVTFSDNGNGTATLSGTPAAGTSGSWPLTFTAANGAGSDATQSFTLTVGASSTTTTVTASTTTPNFGQPVTFTATVVPNAATGSVTFAADGVNKLVVPLASGQAQWTTSGLQLGTRTVTAAYGGQAGVYTSSSGSVSVTVGATNSVTGSRKGGVTITGGSWSIVNAKISGGVSISGGASVAIINSTIGNGITATGATAISICRDTTTTGGISVSGSTGFVLIGSAGDDADMPCGGNTLGGGITLTGNSGGFELGGNTVKGAIVVNNNVLSGPSYDVEYAAPEIEANVVKGSLTCSGNVPAPVDDLQPNRVSGARGGQCGAPGF